MAILTTQIADESMAFLKAGDSVTLPSYLNLPCLVGQGWDTPKGISLSKAGDSGQ